MITIGFQLIRSFTDKRAPEAYVVDPKIPKCASLPSGWVQTGSFHGCGEMEFIVRRREDARQCCDQDRHLTTGEA